MNQTKPVYEAMVEWRAYRATVTTMQGTKESIQLQINAETPNPQQMKKAAQSIHCHCGECEDNILDDLAGECRSREYMRNQLIHFPTNIGQWKSKNPRSCSKNGRTMAKEDMR